MEWLGVTSGTPPMTTSCPCSGGLSRWAQALPGVCGVCGVCRKQGHPPASLEHWTEIPFPVRRGGCSNTGAFKTKLLSLLRSLLFPSHRAIKPHPGGQSWACRTRAVPAVPELFPQPFSAGAVRGLQRRDALAAVCAQARTQLRLPGTVDAPLQPRAQPSRRFGASIPDRSPRARGMSRECSRCSRAAAGQGRAVKSMMGEL